MQSDSFPALTDILFKTKSAVPGKRPWTLYSFPVSYADFDMADHFGESQAARSKRIAEWFDFVWPFVESKGKGTGPKGFNTYLGFFYTITEDWAKDKASMLPSRGRHPWLVVYRPVNVHTKPYRRLELIIWDTSASTKFPSSVTPTEGELIDMQRRVIDHVRQHGPMKNPGTVLDRVWLGGFSPPPCDSPYPIDVTLEFLEHTLANIYDALPAYEDKLVEKGFKRVKLRSDSSDEPQLDDSTFLDQPMDLDSSDEEEQCDDDDTRIIFHPPRGGKLPLGQKSRCFNHLYEQQRLARERDPTQTTMTYQFSPTEDWYRDNKTEGRSYEHIFVSSWIVPFQQFKIGSNISTGNPPASRPEGKAVGYRTMP